MCICVTFLLLQLPEVYVHIMFMHSRPHILTAPRDGAAGDEGADQWGAGDHGTQSHAAVQTTAVSSTGHQGEYVI